MGLITTFCPPMTTGPGETVLQTAGETRFVVDCKMNPAASAGHVKMTFPPERTMVSCGGGGGGNERLNTGPRLNTVPTPELPPLTAVPYRVLPDKINPAHGVAPSLLVT